MASGIPASPARAARVRRSGRTFEAAAPATGMWTCHPTRRIAHTPAPLPSPPRYERPSSRTTPSWPWSRRSSPTVCRVPAICGSPRSSKGSYGRRARCPRRSPYSTEGPTSAWTKPSWSGSPRTPGCGSWGTGTSRPWRRARAGRRPCPPRRSWPPAAGLRVFATGGLGGVHREWTRTQDESADLRLLARTGITVVCAGVKSILDVPATLQRLETLGVTVLGYGTGLFPGFYLTSSGEPVDWTVRTPEEVADVMRAQDALGGPGARSSSPTPSPWRTSWIPHSTTVCWPRPWRNAGSAASWARPSHRSCWTG